MKDFSLTAIRQTLERVNAFDGVTPLYSTDARVPVVVMVKNGQTTRLVHLLKAAGYNARSDIRGNINIHR